MTLVMTKAATEVFAPTDAGGAVRGAVMGEAQTWGDEIEGRVIDLTSFNLDRASISTSTAIATGHNGSTLKVSAAAVTITVPAASGLAEGHVTWLFNARADAAVFVTSTAGDFEDFWLYPGQRATFWRDDTVMRVARPARFAPEDGITFYVSETTGNDANDGLAATRPLATVAEAERRLYSEIDCVGTGPAIQLANGEYTGSVTFTKRLVGYHVASLMGNPADPGQVHWIKASGTAVTARDWTGVIIYGITFSSTGTGATLISSSQHGIIDIWDCWFGACPSGICIQATNGGSVGYVVGGTNNQFLGNCTYCWYVSAGSNLICTGCTIQLSAITFTYFLLCSDCSVTILSGITFSGAGSGSGSTGTKYHSQRNASIILGGLTLPGATAGTTATGGVA